MDWRHWIYGLIATIVNGAATGVVLLLTGLANDPSNGSIRWEAVGTACVILGLLGAANYLKQQPLPVWDGTDRRVP
jgi:hypothetical protein